MITDIVNHWNTRPNTPWHKCNKITPAVANVLSHELDGFDPEDVKSAIDNYHLILTDEMYYWSYKWNILRFFSVTDTKNGNKHIKKWWQFLPESFESERYYNREIVKKILDRQAEDKKLEIQRNKYRSEYGKLFSEWNQDQYDGYRSKWGGGLDWLWNEVKKGNDNERNR